MNKDKVKGDWSVLMVISDKKALVAKGISLPRAFSMRDDIWRNSLGSKVLIRNY